MVGGFGWMERRGVEDEWWVVGVYSVLVVRVTLVWRG